MLLILFNGRTTAVGSNQDLNEVVRCCRLWLSAGQVVLTLLDARGSPRSLPIDQVKPGDLWAGMSPLGAIFNGLKQLSPGLEQAVEEAARAFAA